MQNTHIPTQLLSVTFLMADINLKFNGPPPNVTSLCSPTKANFRVYIFTVNEYTILTQIFSSHINQNAKSQMTQAKYPTYGDKKALHLCSSNCHDQGMNLWLL